MKRAGWILSLALFAWSAGAAAQAAGAPKDSCPISLPYVELEGEFAGCTPSVAAAYDFAFCSFFYHVISLSAPESDKVLGEKSQSAAYRRKATDYAMISAALSNAEALQRNIALAQKFHETLNGGTVTYIRLTIDTIKLKCEGLEGHHSDALDELARSAKSKPGPGN